MTCSITPPPSPVVIGSSQSVLWEWTDIVHGLYRQVYRPDGVRIVNTPDFNTNGSIYESYDITMVGTWTLKLMSRATGYCATETFEAVATADDVCQFCQDNWTPTITEVMALIDAYMYNQPPSGYNFVPTVDEVVGVIDYFLDYVENGDIRTGCAFWGG